MEIGPGRLSPRRCRLFDVKIAQLALALLVLMLAVVFGSFLIEPVEGGTGKAHEVYSETLQQSAPGSERHAKLIWFGWALGVIEILFFVTCLALGASKKGVLGKLKAPLVLGAAIHIAVFSMLILTYRQYMGEAEHALFLSFPATTAWMVYGMWFAPVFYIAIYIIYFPTHILTDADMEKFREILAQKGERDSNNHESGGAS